MTDSSCASAPVVLLKLEPSRLLGAWWLGLHLVIAASLALSHTFLFLVAVPWLLAHGVLRNPVRTELLIVSRGARFGLPRQGRFDLGLSPASRLGAVWAELVFSDRADASLLVIKDQLDGPGWRRLVLALRESA